MSFLITKRNFTQRIKKITNKKDLLGLNIKHSMPYTKEDINEYRSKIIYETDDRYLCFTDKDYVKRRNYIADVSNSYKLTNNNSITIPTIEYTEEENECYRQVIIKLRPKQQENCCKEYNEATEYFDKKLNNKNKVPQIKEINDILYKENNFNIAPVGGLLHPRHFLNSLAFRVFQSTQYVRPIGSMFFNGEPDLIHELCHFPMFMNKDFSDFMQILGVASLGADEPTIIKLRNLYILTIEFGLLRENGKHKILGAAIASSLTELDYAVKEEKEAVVHELDFDKLEDIEYDYTSMSTNYCICDSIEILKTSFIKYSQSLLIKNNIKVDFDYANNNVNNYSILV